MKIHACSIAFRHLNITAATLADYTLNSGFDGLEIWAPHAHAVAQDWAALPCRPLAPMLAGYLPLGDARFSASRARALCMLAHHWGAEKLRLFAGSAGSDAAGPALRDRIIAALIRSADIADDHGLRVAVEIHPGTLADTTGATLALLAEAAHPALGVNFDVLHVWEAGADPLAAFAALAPHVLHFHLKSVTARGQLEVFPPDNIHDPAGSRAGLCPLFDGAIDFTSILAGLPADAEGSLEWFGADPAAVMRADLRQLRAETAVNKN